MNCGYAVTEMDQLLTGVSGQLRIAAGPAWAYGIAPAAVAAMKAKVPGVHVMFTGRMNEATLPLLDAGQLDVVLGGLPDVDDRKPDLAYEPLIEVEHQVFARQDHPLHLKRKVTVSDLAACPWVWFAEAVSGRRLLEAQFDAAGLKPPPESVTTTSMHFGFRVMADSRHLMLLPSTLSGPARVEQLKPLRLGAQVGRYVAGLMYRPSILRLRAFAEFREELLVVLNARS